MTRKKERTAEAKGIEWLVTRLDRTGRYKKIQKHIVWNNKNHGGEYDVLATTHGGVRVYYEWKNRYSKQGLGHAENQSQRSYDFARGGKKMKYVMATPTRIVRLRPYRRGKK